MLGEIIYSNPTKLYFGEKSLDNLAAELKNYSDNVLLVYGGGSIKKNGIYDQVVAILKECGKNITEDGGVIPNPTAAKLKEGCERAKTGKIGFILAVGGGSVCRLCPRHCPTASLQRGSLEKHYLRMEDDGNEIVPVGCVLTMVGTGSEMNGGSVITNSETKLKIGHVFGDNVFPKFSILNPVFTYTLPKYQMVAGIYDIMSHILEQYFSGDDDNTSDYIMEGMLKSLIHSSLIALEDPQNYEARSNIMWTATWALNTFVAQGKTTDWMVHMLGQSVGGYTNATHGMTLAAVSMAYYKHILPYGLAKFKRYAVNVWEVETAGKSDEEIALEGLAKMETYMNKLGLVMNLHELGVTENMLDGITEGVFIMDGGYKVLDKAEIKQILRESM